MLQTQDRWPHGNGEIAALIRSFDWASTSLGPIARWPQSLRTIVDLMLRSPSMMSLVWGDEAIHLYNDRFTDLLKEHRVRALGRPAHETFARSRGVFAADLAAGMAGDSARLVGQRYPVLRNGCLEDAWFDVDYVPVHDETGRVAGVLWTLKETTAQHLAEQALRASAARHRLLIESWTQAVWETDADGRVVADSSSWRAYTGQTVEEWLGYGWLDAIHPDDRAYAERQWREAIAARGQVNAEFRVRAPDGGWRWTNVRAAPVLDAGGAIEKWIGANIDIDERKQAEAALRESEKRFRQFAKASAAGLWIRNADTLAMEFASPALATIYGADEDALLGDATRWAAMIVPEDREVALSHLEAARTGEVSIHEFRIRRPSDGAFRWIRNTDFPFDDDGRIPRIGGIAEDVTEARLAAEHASVLMAELQHRVRNIMAMIRSVTRRTGERAASVPDYTELLMGRLLALARVQALLTRAANVSVGFAGIVHDEVSVQAQHEGQYDLDGPDVALSPKAAEVLTLAVHELATNALKYGALSVADGKVTVRWSVVETRGSPWLVFDWIEEGAPERPPPTRDTPRRRGFGSELIEARVPYELRGRGRVTIEPGGAHCHLEFPLKGGASILETGAPQRMTVFGGALDMTDGPDLKGRRVLVVEDDFYLATDAARALQGAGAEVVGPCASEEDARAELDERRPDAVVVDINLGGGPSFKLAETLKDSGIPFVFTTGYDAEAIPAEFAGIERLEKPFPLRQIVGAVARLTTAA
ncbi:PAS domain S-box-containing protein [Methylobacterium sp. 174MFSha1.1]|uniref:PAS domain-containing protein n=1 Tax=Methylobacterium sp. 174MFSha1.1 TaxID=1502749 RepID=UPI0008EB8811|nr:PAS domain-containing protein [Methylobacterium sp. 174MFSha1.1]SFU30479.1 PAS domain S-box-containing protein [Methylobacterium sp. 174MFSha1.1]